MTMYRVGRDETNQPYIETGELVVLPSGKRLVIFQLTSTVCGADDAAHWFETVEQAIAVPLEELRLQYEADCTSLRSLAK